MKKTTLFFFIFIFSINSFSQNNQTRSPLDSSGWGVVYDIPATKNVKVKPDVPYSGSLTIDVYMPPDAKTGEKRPAVIFLNAIGDRPDSKVKTWEIYKSFPRLVAAHGIVGISMDADGTKIQENLRSLFNFLENDGAKHGIDSNRLGVYAASANVTQSAIYLMSNDVSKGIKAAVLYYGGAPTGRLRKDLPVLFVIAEGDMPRLGSQMPALWQQIAMDGAPWTLQMGTNLPHAFDAFTDNDESRRIIQQTIAFWKSHLEPVPQPDWKPSEARAIVAATYGSDTQKIIDLTTKYLVNNPNEVPAYIYLGRAQQGQQKFDDAVASFGKALKIDPNNAFALVGIGQIRFGQKRYEEAAQFLQKGVDTGFRTPIVYGQLAFSQLNLNRNEESIKSYEKAFEMGIPPGANTRGLAYYNMACAYVRLKQNDKAFEMLNKAADESLNNRNSFETDTDLAPLRSDARFQALLARLPKANS